MIKYRDNQDYSGAIFSFGAGVQSSAIMALLKHEPDRVEKAVGHLPNYALFADTGAENKDSLDNFEFWRKNSPIPLYRLKNWTRNALTNYGDVPAYFNKGEGFSFRTCTDHWKIRPQKEALKRLFPNYKKGVIAQWFGISIDEITRMKISSVKYIENVYPLIEMNLTRHDCQKILAQYGYRSVKSSCYMCPFQSKRWLQNPEIDKAIAYEKEMQKQSKYEHTPYLHPACEPLEDVVAQQKLQGSIFDFLDECDGVCGV